MDRTEVETVAREGLQRILDMGCPLGREGDLLGEAQKIASETITKLAALDAVRSPQGEDRKPCPTCGGRGWHTAGGNGPMACGMCEAGERWEQGEDHEAGNYGYGDLPRLSRLDPEWGRYIDHLEALLSRCPSPERDGSHLPFGGDGQDYPAAPSPERNTERRDEFGLTREERLIEEIKRFAWCTQCPACKSRAEAVLAEFDTSKEDR